MEQKRSLLEEKGAVMLEFAVTSLLFLALVVVTLESAVGGFRALTTQYVASAVVRRAIIGDLNVRQVENFALTLAQNYGIPLERRNIRMCSRPDIDDEGNCRTQSLGGANEYLMVRIMSNTNFLLGTVRIDLFGEAIARNEPPL